MQDFMLEPDRVNEILREFKVRAKLFITEENSIAVKRHKLNWVPKGWALSPEEIEAIDSTFIREIRRAKAEHSKALMPLQRDRVMFHIAIHFALRVSELVAVRVQDFRASDKEDLSHFGKRGVLTALGKNDVTGSVPMRDPSIHALLEWYMGSVREHMVMGRKAKEGDTGMCKSRGRDILVNDLMFISQQGGIIAGNTFRKRLADIAIKAGVLRQKLTPHTLRHTGCTLMVPLYSPEIAQKYMRHKHLHTTLYYYHPTPLQAGNEVNAATALFDDDEED
jgi:integrase